MRLVRYTYPSYRSLAPVSGRFAPSPWSGLDTEIDRLFASALGDFSGAVTARRFPVDLYEDKANTYVRAELPGENRDDITVEVVDGYLTITAARKTPATARASTPAGDAQAQTETTVSFSRSLALTDEVQADQVSAAYENGVLTVTLPKREEVKAKKVTIKVS